MKVLITGGAGFLGRHFSTRFLQLDCEVTVVDSLINSGGGVRPSSNLIEKNKNFKFFNADCIDFFSDNSKVYDLVLHLAAVVGGRLSIENERFNLLQNTVIDYKTVEWAIKSKPKQLILFSSSAVYPVHLQTKNKTQALRESDFDIQKLNGSPDLSYGWCKQNLEFLAKTYHETTGLSCSVFRPFSGYGADQSLNYPIPSLCHRILTLKENQPLQVWGTGNQARDFVHVEDLVEAVLKTYSKLTNASAVNICSGQATSFLQVAGILKDILNQEFSIETLSK